MPNKKIGRIRSSISHNLLNIPGWRTRRKIVVFESDDWGSIRMPSMEVYSEFRSKGLSLTQTDYNRVDALESNDDLSMLFDVLRSYRDRNDRHPVFTANIVVGNPDFDRIRSTNFIEYYFEPVTETIKYYPGRDSVVTLWKKGNSEGLFHPQFHSREHVNVNRWMNALRGGNPEIMLTFEHRTTFSGYEDYNFMEVLDNNSPEEIDYLNQSITEGLNLFESIMGYRSRSFIPPCYTWDSEIEKNLHLNGVRYMQGLIVQLVPTGSFGNYRRKYHFLGTRNPWNMIFLTRNCFFEPSLSESDRPVEDCLRRIDLSFRWNKPAVICTHRLNYIGSLDQENRRNNLNSLGFLLEKILTSWPDVEFMSSDQLGDLIVKTRSKL